jgi:glycosyltransferase involved in cell wall biosynthesis
MHIHGGGFKTYFNDGYEAFVKKTLNKCDKIVVLSEEWKKWFCDELQYDNVAVIPNVIPIPQSCERREGDEKFHLLFLGLINKEKGIFDLIEAIAESKDQLHGKFLLHIAGNGMVSRLKNEINNKELQDVVKYEGWVDRDAKHELLCGCDTLVLPSYIEGLPMSILEAMSYHKPILSTPVGGIPSVLEDGVNGFLLEPGDGMGFIEKVIYLMEHEDAAKLMGESSFKKISEHFPESVAEKLVKLYKELIN